MNYAMREQANTMPMYSSSDRGFSRLLSNALFTLGVLLLGGLFGMVASTGHPVIVGIAAGTLVGVVLVARPVWTMWLVLVLGILVAGLVPIWAEGAAAKAVWGVAVLGFTLMGLAFLRAITTPAATQETPGFVWLSLLFVAYVLLNGILQSGSAYEIASGFKRYFQAFGLIFAFAWLRIDAGTVGAWRRFMLVAALVQLPFALYQLIKLVPLREGWKAAYPGLIPVDVVAGTFGANLYSGGANAEMATFLLIVLAFMLSRMRFIAASRRRLLLIMPLVLAPLFLGETKVVVVLLPMMFLVLYRREMITKPHVALAGLLVCGLLTIAAGYAYLGFTNKTLNEQVAATLSYNVYDEGYGSALLNRTTVLTFWAEKQGADNPISAVFGGGVGSSHAGTGGYLAARYAGFGIGLTAASTLLWEQGMFGLILFVLIFVFAWRTANELLRLEVPLWVQADARAIQAAIAIFVFYLLYRLAPLETLSFQIVVASTLGYLAWLRAQYRGQKGEPSSAR